ncbi:MAG: 16S rRNA (guanine(966)-N(2))-methyltransferase RsmD [Clostridiales bacterium]|nr:16S rRNA (guanine(966)-N(2))-methyltransferase RsmD [Clostridiales bacterium]
MAVKILGGIHRSRMLRTPTGQDTRPTRAMVREAIFNILRGETEGARVLDLFAGSGAMGFEALSRGAAHAVFCDKAANAARTVKENARLLKLEDCCTVLQLVWPQALAHLKAQQQEFDLIFLDPPYKMDVEPVLLDIAQAGLLADSGQIVLEQSTGQASHIPDMLAVDKARQYGQTSLYFITHGRG